MICYLMCLIYLMLIIFHLLLPLTLTKLTNVLLELEIERVFLQAVYYDNKVLLG
jgi:hypothetical protein